MKMPHNLHIDIKLHSVVLKQNFSEGTYKTVYEDNYPNKYVCLHLA